MSEELVAENGSGRIFVSADYFFVLRTGCVAAALTLTHSDAQVVRLGERGRARGEEAKSEGGLFLYCCPVLV